MAQSAAEYPSPISVGPEHGVGTAPLTRDRARAVLGQTMGLVALTLGFLVLGAYIGRDLDGGIGILFFVAGFACIFGLGAASARGKERLAITLLFGLGLLLGLALGPGLRAYADADPAAIWQAAGVTAGFVGALGTYGYATRRDLSPWFRTLFWALIALLVFGIVALFVSIPNENVIWSVAGLVSFGGWTIFDFNRLRRAGEESAAPIAASIFLDVLNVFLFVLQGRRSGTWRGRARGPSGRRARTSGVLANWLRSARPCAKIALSRVVTRT